VFSFAKSEQDNSDSSQGEFSSQRQHIVQARVLGGERGQQLTLGQDPTGSIYIMSNLNQREDNDVDYSTSVPGQMDRSK